MTNGSLVQKGLVSSVSGAVGASVVLGAPNKNIEEHRQCRCTTKIDNALNTSMLLKYYKDTAPLL